MTRYWKVAAFAAVVGAAALIPTSFTDAQLNLNGRPHRGTHTLRTGFTPDPWNFPLTAGGGRNPVDLSRMNMPGCPRGYVTSRPDFRFNFASGAHFDLLRFYITSQADSLLLVNQPNGTYRCNDDHGESGWGNSLMPAITYRNPPGGRYDIWVGTYNLQSNQPAVLHITELDGNHP